MTDKFVDDAKITESDDVVETPTFDEMGLGEDLLRGIYGYGFERPSKIQQKAIVPMVKGRDILAQAQSGTGKTGTFVIGSLSHVKKEIKKPQVLVLCHVHELAKQIYDVAVRIGYKMDLKVLMAIGGTSPKDDIRALEEGAQFIVGTPGRVQDLIKRGVFDRTHIQWLIMDECDQMLEDLFYKQVMDILRMGFPQNTKVALLSATMPPKVIEVASTILNDPVRILIPPTGVRVDLIKQYFVGLDREDHKFECICDLYKNLNIVQAVIFCNKKQKAEMLSQRMNDQGYPTSCLHGDLEKPERRRRMEEFMRGDTRVLVATDIIARGIDNPRLNLVVNFELPNSSKEAYVHRIGRVGRNGRPGVAINLLTQDEYSAMEEIATYYGMSVLPLPNELNSIKM